MTNTASGTIAFLCDNQNREEGGDYDKTMIIDRSDKEIEREGERGRGRKAQLSFPPL